MGPGKILRAVRRWLSVDEQGADLAKVLANPDLTPAERKRLIEEDEADRLAW